MVLGVGGAAGEGYFAFVVFDFLGAFVEEQAEFAAVVGVEEDHYGGGRQVLAGHSGGGPAGERPLDQLRRRQGFVRSRFRMGCWFGLLKDAGLLEDGGCDFLEAALEFGVVGEGPDDGDLAGAAGGDAFGD